MRPQGKWGETLSGTVVPAQLVPTYATAAIQGPRGSGGVIPWTTADDMATRIANYLATQPVNSADAEGRAALADVVADKVDSQYKLDPAVSNAFHTKLLQLLSQ